MRTLWIIFAMLVLSCFGCEWEHRQEQISRCIDTCNATDCRPEGGSIAARTSEACHQCVLRCSEVS